MAGAQFEYDEQGHTFLYVIISFYFFMLFPLTWLLWPKRSKRDGSSESASCQCDGCLHKRLNKRSKEPWANAKRFARWFFISILWIGFVALTYKTWKIDVKHEEYDPFGILELDPGASVDEVKKAYRVLSKKYHPDRPGGDEQKFVAISKAHAALTDDESRKNWELYGNPDGPGATTFGIALPKWIVSKEYGIWVLAIYGLVFMIVLPSAVGIWWYNSIKYSADQVLRDTSQLFLSLFYKTPNMVVKRAIMVMSGAFEFWRAYNKDVVERPSDDRELPSLIKDLPTKFDSKQEKPLCFPYAVKARAIMHAHLYRIQLQTDTLDVDRAFILHKVPLLVQEMIQVFAQLVMFASTGRINRMPKLETLENVMKLMPMFVQASWESRSPLLQLPHFTEDMLRHCVTKKRRIRTCADLASMDDADRRQLLRVLSSEQYRDILLVLRAMPRVTVDYKLEVTGEDDKEHISAGSLVTVKCTLKRSPLLDASLGNLCAPGTSQSGTAHTDNDAVDDDSASVAAGDTENLIEDDDEKPDDGKQKAPARKPWEKPQKKKKGGKANKGGGGGAQNKSKQPPPNKKAAALAAAAAAAETSEQQQQAPATPESSKRERGDRDDKSDNEDDRSDGENSVSDSDLDDLQNAHDEANEPESEDEEALAFDDDLMKKERILETKSKITHPVHCPFFPEEKYEWWWVYLCDRKRKMLVSAPQSVTSLVTEQMVELRFPAPPVKGTYTYQICVRSDSYMDADVNKTITFTVHEAKQMTSHPQWDFATDDEKEGDKSMDEHSDLDVDYTEGEEEDDD